MFTNSRNAARVLTAKSLAMAAMAVMFPISAHASGYSIVDLGTLGGGTYCLATGISNNGDIVGESDRVSGPFHAFVWTNGVMHDLTPAYSGPSTATAINYTGDIVGNLVPVNGTPSAFLHLKTQAFGTNSSLGFQEAKGLNHYDVVVGDSGGNAVSWSSGTVTTLPGLGGSPGSVARGIALGNMICGYSNLPSGQYHATTWFHGVVKDLGDLIGGTSYSFSTAIDNNNVVVGWSLVPNGQEHPFAYYNNAMHDLGTLQPADTAGANCISNNGVVGGFSGLYGEDYHAAVWSSVTSAPVDLNTQIPAGQFPAYPNFLLQQVVGINDYGKVVAFGRLNGNTHSFLLTPK